MTAAFQYEEPATIPMTANATEASSLAEDPAAAALSMINNGPSVPVDTVNAVDADSQEEEIAGDPVNQEEGTVDEEVESDDEPAVYSDEEYAELCRQADEDYALELQRLETEYAQAGVDRSKIQDELKDAKSNEKHLLESIRKLQAEGPAYPDRTKPKKASQGDGSAPDQSQSTVTAYNSDVPHADPDNLVGDTPEHEEYYNTPTATLLAEIDGLGKAKLEALVEVAPTVRDLVRLQIQAGRFHHGGLHEVLPKGFGKALGERIDQRLMDRMPLVVK